MSDELNALLDSLIALPAEVDWCEFKVNNSNPEMIAETICALGNSATLLEMPAAYFVWGVEDDSHRVVGTTFNPASEKKGNEPLISWLSRMIEPDPIVEFNELAKDGERVLICTIRAATRVPYRFKGDSFLRVGGTTRRAKDMPEREKLLWAKLNATEFEDQAAIVGLKAEDVRELVDVPAYFRLLKVQEPGEDKALEALAADRILELGSGGLWTITNLGGLLFARDMRKFSTIFRKAIRVVIYDGDNRIKTKREIEGRRGYALAFPRVVNFIETALPRNEEIRRALRTDTPVFPVLAIRELIANALVHQDFNIKGAGPLIEMFDDRLEISNPGRTLVDVRRLLDLPPRSRNERLASLMRRMGVCEERGSGIDKVLFEVEFSQLPPPDFKVTEESTRVTLFGPRPFREMDREERIRACYQHAGLMFVSSKRMTNASLRKRFAMPTENAAQVSRIIRDALQEGSIKVADPKAPKSGYVPFWA